MLGSKLIRLLRTLDKKELKEFHLFTGSAFFNKNESLLLFLEQLSAYHPDLNQDILNREQFFSKNPVFPAYSDQKVRYLLSDLTKVLEEFIAYKEFKRNPFNAHFQLANALLRRNQEKFFLQELEVLKNMNESAAFRDHGYYFNLHQLSEIAYEYTSGSRNRAFDTSLQELMDNLEISYLSKSLRFYCEMINRRNILSVTYNLRFFDQVMNYIQEGGFDDIPAIRIYRLIYISLMQPGNHENYLSLLKELDQTHHLFSLKEQRGMYVFAQNYCIRRINAGEKGALEDIFALYQKMVDRDLIYEGNYVSQPDFKNIVTTGLRLGASEWVESFIEKYRSNLHPDFSENAYNYSMAWVYFTRKAYDKALRILLRVEFNDVYYHLDAKSLLMKVYYEMNEFDPFLSLVDAFKIYLRRNRFISELQKKTYSNFIALLNKLMKVKLGKLVMSPELHQEIVKTKPAADLIWLQAKSTELMARYRIPLPESGI